MMDVEAPDTYYLNIDIDIYHKGEEMYNSYYVLDQYGEHVDDMQIEEAFIHITPRSDDSLSTETTKTFTLKEVISAFMHHASMFGYPKEDERRKG